MGWDNDGIIWRGRDWTGTVLTIALLSAATGLVAFIEWGMKHPYAAGVILKVLACMFAAAFVGCALYAFAWPHKVE